MQHEEAKRPSTDAAAAHSVGQGQSKPAGEPDEMVAYEVAQASVAVRDPKRANYTFKSQTSGGLFDSQASQPPDAIQSIQTAILLRHWTSSGSPFSTRERFPRVRARWKD